MMRRIDNSKITSGSLLISEPLLADFNFCRALVLITSHTNESTFGLVLNKPSGKYLNNVIYGFDNTLLELYIGGPVEQNTLHYIHTLGELVNNSIRIANNLYWGGDIEDLRYWAAEGRLSKQNVRFFIGYSGWTEGQLDDEISEKSWVVSSADGFDIFSVESNVLWERAVKGLGNKYKEWLNYPIDPILN